jgi:hypothetical protein
VLSGAKLWATSRPHLPLALLTAALATITTARVLERTGGAPAVPLDDAFIHFQYARSFAEFRALVYTPGAEPVAGATSLLWPVVLAPFHLVGFRGESIIWVAWLFGWVSLGMLAHETRRLAEGITREEIAIAAAAMVLAFGGHAWFAGSGMEVIPLSWVLIRSARRTAEWAEGAAGDEGRRRELVLLGLLAPLLRPEAAIASIVIAIGLALHPRGGRFARAYALVPLAGLALPALVNQLLTGQATNTTALVKWLPLSPYHRGERLLPSVRANLELLFGTLLDGRQWSAIFLPQGGKYVAWLALPALLALSIHRKAAFRGALCLLVALGILIPTTYDSFLWNRLRYLWPFAAAWFVALAALADGIGVIAARHFRHGAALGLLVAGGFTGALASHLSYAIDDLAESSDAIRRQQASLGHWAREHLPETAIIGVNDTGAIAYLSERRTFDVVGLTTRGEARYWVAGRGSRFEHFEKLEPARRPTHFIVYPEWLGHPPLLGELLTERVVQASILGGTRMAAHVADTSALGLGEEPREPPARPRIDALDVADLESEAEHAYALLDATQMDDALEHTWVGDRQIADGARRQRAEDRFELTVEPGGLLVARVGLGAPAKLVLWIDGQRAGERELPGLAWQEVTLELPRTIAPGRRAVRVTAEGSLFSSMHYWSYR